MPYIGRFAPSPTGPLHYGSLVAGLASYLDARHAHGKWLLRIEDLDPPRESEEAPSEIMSQLEAYRLLWDDEVLFQSTRLTSYDELLNALSDRHCTFYCNCSRKKTPSVYAGTCRDRHLEYSREPCAIRFRVPNEMLSIADRVYGTRTWDLEKEVGDFIIRRRDGLHAYQLAVVADDHHQQVNHIVRGADLLSSTPKQLAIYQTLNWPVPSYLHVPVLTDQAGNKLSKQRHAKPLQQEHQLDVLRSALNDLGQDSTYKTRQISDLLKHAIEAWRPTGIPSREEITAPENYE